MAHPQTLGVILAGGHARRMGGSDKARIRIGGATILERVLGRLRPQCRGLIVSANAGAERFADTGLPVVADTVPDYPGPLAGVLAALEWTKTNAPATAWVVSVPNDCPFLPRDLISSLHAARADADAQLACASSGERRHPVIALWPIELADELRHALTAEGVRRVGEWIARHRIGIAAWPVVPIDPFINVNTPADVAEAERLATQHPEM